MGALLCANYEVQSGSLCCLPNKEESKTEVTDEQTAAPAARSSQLPRFPLPSTRASRTIGVQRRVSGDRFSNSASRRRSCPPKSDASAFISVVRPLPQLPSSTLRDDSWVKTRSPHPPKTALGTERGVSARKGGPRDNFFSIRGKAQK